MFPPENEIFSALNLCPISQAKVVILGQDPYHNKGQANGLSFSVAKGVALPPSLHNVLLEQYNDVYAAQHDQPYAPVAAKMQHPEAAPGYTVTHGDLSGWARQGVLLLNTVLTVRYGPRLP